MTFWPLTNSDFPTDQIFHQFHDLYTELDLHRIMSGFHGAFATGVASQQGTLTLPDTWFRPQFWDLLVLQLLRPNSSNLPCLYSTFHLGYPLVLSRFCLWKSNYANWCHRSRIHMMRNNNTSAEFVQLIQMMNEFDEWMITWWYIFFIVCFSNFDESYLDLQMIYFDGFSISWTFTFQNLVYLMRPV